MGVATGVTMDSVRHELGALFLLCRRYFWRSAGIEGLMAFFWKRHSSACSSSLEELSKVQHLAVTWLVALGSNFSALWILVANSWMLNPVGARFNPQTMRMELTSFSEVLFNPVAQSKFVHTVSAGYVTGAMFVMSIGAYYMLRGAMWHRAAIVTVAASFGLASALSVVVLGDESGYTTGLNQKMKIAAIEAMWETEPAPASFTLFGLPDMLTRRRNTACGFPWVLGLIATRSLDTAGRGHQASSGERRTTDTRRSARLRLA